MEDSAQDQPAAQEPSDTTSEAMDGVVPEATSSTTPNAPEEHAPPLPAPSNPESILSSPAPAYPDDADEETRIASLAAGIRDQDDLERDIGRQADALLLEQADERDNKRLAKTQTDRSRLEGQIHRLERKLEAFGNSATKNKIRAEIHHYNAQIKDLDKDLVQIQRRIQERHAAGDNPDGETLLEDKGGKMPGESQREFLIRTGKITPFSKVGRQLLRTSSSLADVMLDAEEEEEEDVPAQHEREEVADEKGRSHRNLIMPGFAELQSEDQAEDDDDDDEDFQDERPAKRRRIQKQKGKGKAIREDHDADAEMVSPSEDDDDDDAFIPDIDDRELAAVGESADEDEPEDEDVDGEFSLATAGTKRKKAGKTTNKKAAREVDAEEDLTGIDDGNEKLYQRRLQSWIQRRSAARRKANRPKPEDENESEMATDEGSEPEWHLPLPNKPDAEFENGYKVPGDIYPSLFDYQKTGVQWLWELYSQQAGGIIGDEMGLGKTIQIISFLAGLHYSGKLTKPIIVVTPATVMKQWVNEFHRWWPPLRVSILHTSGSGMLDLKRESRLEDDLERREFGTERKSLTQAEKAAKRIVDRVARDGHVLVTTYSGLQTYAEFLIPMDWEYAVLDEGHKIRNPNTAITIYCKELRTHNRIILSGTPMQNNLTELWSLFDFVFPMRLGTLVSFRQQFEFPIKQGGYANASNLQVETAMKCAETLKDTISPYLLQRFKVDVASDLPKKSERVLFCKLTKLQRDAYETFLNSEEMKRILDGKRQALYGIDILRKICNHPDLVEHKTLSLKADYNYGSGVKSGKMQVVKALLEIWRKNGHKTLLFAQHRIMLDILQRFVSGLGGFNFLRMDGNTSIKDRQNLVDRFNKDPDLHVFLLTTKVGGLGVNLTGADRVIIYDPDWNPSTDVQARERAWRLGQKREVEIYRLMTAGTIEEKIYHRQIFKQFLTNKILKDPKQRQTFQLRDLHDLFTLGDAEDGTTETGSIFKGTEVKLSGNARETSPANHEKGPAEGAADEEKAEELRQKRKAEVDNLTGISHTADYQSAADDQSAASKPVADSNATNKDDRVLAGIFARSGVQSALSHDDIISGNSNKPRKVRADPEIIAREARRVAANAAAELRRAGEIARNLPAGSVSWTGQYGDVGRVEERTPARRGGFGSRGRGGFGGAGGPSSASVLANLSARQSGPAGIATSSSPSASTSRAGTPASDHQPKGREFLSLIRDYLVAHGGKVHTQMLIDHFNRFCGTARRTAEFKEMLKTIATFEPSASRGRGGRGGGGGSGGSGGRGKWALKEEYRPKRE